MVRDNRPDIVLIQETKMSKEKVENIKFFKDNYIIEGSSEGSLGGIATFWNGNSIEGEVISQDNNMTSIRFHHLKDNTSWVLTNIYAPNTKNERKKFWLKIDQAISLFEKESWIVLGDFNTHLKEDEKIGGSQPNLDNSLDLMNFITRQALIDIDLQGISYTWTNRRECKDLIQVRLDRALITNDWYQNYYCSLTAFVRAGSNHYPLSFIANPISRKRNFPFRFEKMWTLHPEFN